MTHLILSAVLCTAAPVPQEVRVEVRIIEGDPLGRESDKDANVLQAPRVTVALNQLSQVSVGGWDQSGRFIGTQFAINVSPAENGRLTLAFMAEYTRQRGRERQVRVNTTTPIELGKTTKIRLGANSPSDQTWAEVTVRPAPPESEVRPPAIR